jgi:hypothetical protein
MSNNEKKQTPTVFVLVDEDNTHGNAGVKGVFNTREKAEIEMRSMCPNGVYYCYIIEEWPIE